jgi:hypothetical protein
VNLRLTGWAKVDTASLPEIAVRASGAAMPSCPPTGLAGGPDLTFVERSALLGGDEMAGPVVVTEPTATTFVPRGWRLAVDRQGHLDLRRIPASS